ncbi:glycoside hydrolase family 2 protein [Agarivorans sp. 1_MG-2023]|uniref:beta-mannosidase n=1 Tax=Agarivorans sp. 1_MG-2023 TaxID=3062634 RepID=UPI0026E442EE|nr:glycoside hydrolase family 2 protein [Agarivorans sp. 1_MG-2023]MDO6765814.1 glycoside hydrolase family 2 protein [Agarivorans sp. 1_MG-2023]
MTHLNVNQNLLLTSPDYPEIEIACQIPGDNHSALLNAGLIPDPYSKCNEQDVQWVGQADWQLSTEFELSDEQLNHDFIELALSRVDTVADVYLNDQLLASCDNMFRLWRFNIKPFVKAGSNQLRVYFHRADVAAKQRADSLPFVVPSSMGNNQIPYMNSLRKSQCHAGWDWGICLMVSGIYDPVQIKLANQARLLSTQIEQHWQGQAVELVITIKHDLDCLQPIHLILDDQHVEVIPELDSQTSVARIHLDNPKLWWPAGYGEQPLYTLQVSLAEQRIEKKIGLRKLELDTRADSHGSAMTFVINGCPITAKGANWIPLDAMPSRQTPQRYRQLLSDAKAANMNMIRVWGGGQYEADDFYQLCDELGLMVWQDMMFACSLYPSTDDFVANVQLELADQIQRLRDHSCIVLWCGDNEVIGAINWYPESKTNRERYVVNYDRLNRAVQQVVEQHDASRVFWPSSPCNGALDYGDAWHDDSQGDMHFWDVWHSGKSFAAYQTIKPRFCSEFGYQSWPSLAEVKTFVEPEDWNVTSPTFENHQKNPSGNSIITEMFTRLFRFPASFEQMLYLSQVQQALAIKTACDYWRANSPVCRGMLYWQLNDNWPVSSWSSIEYSGCWKQLHYHAKRFFAPQYLSFVESDEALELRLINDSASASVLDCQLQFVSWQGEVGFSKALELNIAADANDVVWTMPLAELEKQRTQGFYIVQWRSNGDKLQNTWVGEAYKSLAIAKAEVSVQLDEATQSITLSTNKPAFFVHLESDASGRFSDSSFTLLPQQPISLNYMGDEFERMAASLRVYHLADSY